MKKSMSIFALIFALVSFANAQVSNNNFSLVQPANWHAVGNQIQIDANGAINQAFYELTADVTIKLSYDGEIDSLMGFRFPALTNPSQNDDSKWSLRTKKSNSGKEANYSIRICADTKSDASHLFNICSTRVCWEHFIIMKTFPTAGTLTFTYNNIQAKDVNGATVPFVSSMTCVINFGDVDYGKESFDIDLANPFCNAPDLHNSGQGSYGCVLSNGKHNWQYDSLSTSVATKCYETLSEFWVNTANGKKAAKITLVSSDNIYNVYSVSYSGEYGPDANGVFAGYQVVFKDVSFNNGNCGALELVLRRNNHTYSEMYDAYVDSKFNLLDTLIKKGLIKRGDLNQQFGDFILDKKDLELLQKIAGKPDEVLKLTYYQQWAADLNGDTRVDSNDVKILKQIVDPTSVVDIPSVEFRAYPNPFVEGFKIDISTEGELQCLIYDLTGNLVKSENRMITNFGPQDFRLDVPAGAYVAVIIQNGTVGIAHLTKN